MCRDTRAAVRARNNVERERCADTNVERRARPSHEVLRNLFGLTPKESELACELVAGGSLRHALP